MGSSSAFMRTLLLLLPMILVRPLPKSDLLEITDELSTLMSSILPVLQKDEATLTESDCNLLGRSLLQIERLTDQASIICGQTEGEDFAISDYIMSEIDEFVDEFEIMEISKDPGPSLSTGSWYQYTSGLFSSACSSVYSSYQRVGQLNFYRRASQIIECAQLASDATDSTFDRAVSALGLIHTFLQASGELWSSDQIHSTIDEAEMKKARLYFKLARSVHDQTSKRYYRNLGLQAAQNAIKSTKEEK